MPCRFETEADPQAGRSGMYASPTLAIPAIPPIQSEHTPATFPHPYPYLVRILTLANEMTRIFVTRAGDDNGITSAFESTQFKLNEYHNDLPFPLRFETGNFQSYASLEQGGAFVLLHVSCTLRVINQG